jgi:hypothetical protein
MQVDTIKVVMTEHNGGIEYDKIEIIKETTSGTKTQKTDKELRIHAETMKMLKRHKGA